MCCRSQKQRINPSKSFILPKKRIGAVTKLNGVSPSMWHRHTYTVVISDCDTEMYMEMDQQDTDITVMLHVQHTCHQISCSVWVAMLNALGLRYYWTRKGRARVQISSTSIFSSGQSSSLNSSPLGLFGSWTTCVLLYHWPNCGFQSFVWII